jgi:hypothetical protein
MQTRSFVGLDVHKASISISIAEDGRSGPVHTSEEVAKMAKRIAGMASWTSAMKLVVAGTASIVSSQRWCTAA